MCDDFELRLNRADKLSFLELERHALIGRVCGCQDCLCCAAVRILEDRRELQEGILRNERFAQWAEGEDKAAALKAIEASKARLADLERGLR
jgi:hypothetical protein